MRMESLESYFESLFCDVVGKLLLLFSCSGMSYSLRPQGRQHAMFPCPSLSSGVCSNSCPLSWWCYPTISSSIALFSSCPQLFPASVSFPMSQLFTSSGQIIGASALASAFPMNIQSWFSLGLTYLISLQSKGLSRVFSSTTIWKHLSLALSLLYSPAFTSVHDYWKNHGFD